LSRQLPLQSIILLEGFWPSSNWRSNYVRASVSTVMDVVDPEDPIQIPYCGPKNMRPLTVDMSFKKLNVGNFVFLKPHDPNLIPLWMGRA
jgi:hypothetical protein